MKRNKSCWQHCHAKIQAERIPAVVRFIEVLFYIDGVIENS